MPTSSLPDRPDLDQLRRRAKELRDAARAGDPAARDRINAKVGDVDPTSLATAQLVVAREHGFDSWPKLKSEVEARALDLAERVDALLYSSLHWRTGRAVELLRREPSIATYDGRTAVVLGEADFVRRMLERDPELPFRRDRQTGWTALLGACMSWWHRIDPSRADGLREVARLLLDAGADPNVRVGERPGDPWYCSPLYAAAGCVDNPAITALLLERGGVADEHTVYLAAFHKRHDCLRMLLANGSPIDDTALAAPVSTGDVEVARMLLDAGAHPTRPIPAEALEEGHPGDTALHAAVERNSPVELVELLLEHGADPNAPGWDGRSPHLLAVRRGRSDLAEVLRRHGARDDSTGNDQFLDACLRADREAAERLVSRDPRLVERLTDEDLGAIVYAAERGHVDAVLLMLDLGFPTDVRGGENGATPLHTAAAAGSVRAVRLLLDRGADIHARDRTWDCVPLVWASVCSGFPDQIGPDADFVTVIQTLIDAGSSLENAWIDIKPPSPEVAQLLNAHGVEEP